MKPVLKHGHEAKRGLFAVDSCQQLSNTVRAEFKIKNWLQEGFASFNVNTTLNQNNVSGFETKTNGYILVNWARRNCESWKTAFDVNLK
jgi:iron complex outermembrane receptor protein